MKPTLRDNFFLAKIANSDVDIATLTPPIAVSEREKLLMQIADKASVLPTVQKGATIEFDGSYEDLLKVSCTVNEEPLTAYCLKEGYIDISDIDGCTLTAHNVPFVGDITLPVTATKISDGEIVYTSEMFAVMSLKKGMHDLTFRFGDDNQTVSINAPIDGVYATIDDMVVEYGISGEVFIPDKVQNKIPSNYIEQPKSAVTVTVDEDDNYIADMSIEEIYESISSGTHLYCMLDKYTIAKVKDAPVADSDAFELLEPALVQENAVSFSKVEFYPAGSSAQAKLVTIAAYIIGSNSGQEIYVNSAVQTFT